MYTLIIYIKQNSTVLSFLQFSINRLHKIIWMKRYSWDNCLTTGCTNFLSVATTAFFPYFFRQLLRLYRTTIGTTTWKTVYNKLGLILCQNRKIKLAPPHKKMFFDKSDENEKTGISVFPGFSCS